MINVDAKTTALVLIDLQDGILGYPLAPLSGPELLSRGRALAERFRAAKVPVVLVNVAWSADSKDVLRAPVDYPTHPEGGFPKGFSNLGAGLAKDGDILITKRQWSAFTGTELDLQLRRRGIRTIVLGGVWAWNRPLGRLGNSITRLSSRRTQPRVSRPTCMSLQ
jgi:nicotinamidase-related amidase